MDGRADRQTSWTRAAGLQHGSVWVDGFRWKGWLVSGLAMCTSTRVYVFGQEKDVERERSE